MKAIRKVEEWKIITEKDKFIKHMAKTGMVSTDEWVMFLLEHYFMQDLSLYAYKEELEIKYGYSKSYALACYKEAQGSIEDFIKCHKDTSKTWEQELKRKGGDSVTEEQRELLEDLILEQQEAN